MRKTCLAFLFYFIYPSSFAAEARLVAEGWQQPWGLSFIDNQRLLISEKAGAIHLYDLQSQQRQKLSLVPSLFTRGQGGLLDIAIAPPQNMNDQATGAVSIHTQKDVFISYSKAIGDGGATTLAKAQLRLAPSPNLGPWQELLVSDVHSDSGRHFGSRISFDQSHVYFSIGDRGNRALAQQADNLAGVIVRLHRDGSIPNDNPLMNDKQARKEIFSLGHRNPQGLFFDPERQMLFSNEHGPRGGDEINIVYPGENYGWPILSHGKEYWGPIAVGEATERAGFVSPIWVYTPSIAISSLMVYRGDQYPNWQGDLFSSALKLSGIYRVKLDAKHSVIEHQHLLADIRERIRAIQSNPAGEIFFITDSGKLFQLISD